MENENQFLTIYKKGKYIFRYINPNFYFNKWKFLSLTPIKIKQRKDRKIKISIHLYFSEISNEYVNPFELLNLDIKKMSKDLYDKYKRYILIYNIGNIRGKNKENFCNFIVGFALLQKTEYVFFHFCKVCICFLRNIQIIRIKNCNMPCNIDDFRKEWRRTA